MNRPPVPPYRQIPDQLNKERLESWDDVRHAFDNFLKRSVGGFVWHRQIGKRYVDGSLTIHLHFVWVSDMACINVSVAGDAQCDRGISTCATRVFDGETHRTSGLNLANSEDGESVLVTVYDFMQVPERLIPSVVRLNALNALNGRCGESIVRETTNAVFCWNHKNREIDLITPSGERLTVESSCEFPSNIVKGGTKIPNTITNNASEEWRRRRISLRAECGLERITLLLKDESCELCLFISPTNSLKQFEMLLSPDDFEPRSV